MRIVGGSARGRRLKSPPGSVRPTSGRVREALFSILQNNIDISNARFLDLFAGSGAIGLEALSRGARQVVFVDENPARTAAITKHLETFGWKNRALVFRQTAKRFLSNVREPFDIVFVDPPYHSGQASMTANLISENNSESNSENKLVQHNGVLVFEHPSSSLVNKRIYGFLPAKRYKYGDTTLSVYKLE